MKRTINSEIVEGRLYQHNLELKTVQNKNYDNVAFIWDHHHDKSPQNHKKPIYNLFYPLKISHLLFP